MDHMKATCLFLQRFPGKKSTLIFNMNALQQQPDQPSVCLQQQNRIYNHHHHPACLLVWKLLWFHVSLISVERAARSICLPLTVAARETRLYAASTCPCESLYKKFPLVTCLSWKCRFWGSWNQEFCFSLHNADTCWWSWDVHLSDLI